VPGAGLVDGRGAASLRDWLQDPAEATATPSAAPDFWVFSTDSNHIGGTAEPSAVGGSLRSSGDDAPAPSVGHSDGNSPGSVALSTPNGAVQDGVPAPAGKANTAAASRASSSISSGTSSANSPGQLTTAGSTTNAGASPPASAVPGVPVSSPSAPP